MTRDPAKYKDPEDFDPDRFFDENGKLNNDDVAYVFGFGRRFVLYFISSIQRLEQTSL
jgi:cytochrome P450